MPAFPNSSMVHVDQPLTNLSVAYIQDQSNFIASQVFPTVAVNKQSDRYFRYAPGTFNRRQAKKRAPGSAAVVSGFEIDNTPTYYCDVYALAQNIPQEVIANADDAIDPERDASRFVMHSLLIEKEYLWASTYFTTSVWGTDITGVSGTPSTGQVKHWSDYTDGDPISNVTDAITAVQENTAFRPNTMVMSRRVMDALKDHPDLVDRVKYTNAGTENPSRVNERTLAALFGLDRILISDAVYNTADLGQTDSNTFVMGKNALLCYVPARAGLMTPSAGYTFSWRGLGGNDAGVAVRRFDGESMQIQNSVRIEGQMAFDQKVVASDLGYFFSGIVA